MGSEHILAGTTRYDWFDKDEAELTSIELAAKVHYELKSDITAFYKRLGELRRLRAENATLTEELSRKQSHTLRMLHSFFDWMDRARNCEQDRGKLLTENAQLVRELVVLKIECDRLRSENNKLQSTWR